MEIKASLKNYTQDERLNFIINYNHNQGYEIKEYNTTELVEQEVVNPETGEVEIVQGEIVTSHLEAWGYTQEELELQEKERIAKLSLTKREVFLGLYQAKGVTPDMIKTQITDPQALIEFEYANDYYRGNPLIDIVGATLGITPEQLDCFFQTKNYTCLLSPLEEEQIIE